MTEAGDENDGEDDFEDTLKQPFDLLVISNSICKQNSTSSSLIAKISFFVVHVRKFPSYAKHSLASSHSTKFDFFLRRLFSLSNLPLAFIFIHFLTNIRS